MWMVVLFGPLTAPRNIGYRDVDTEERQVAYIFLSLIRRLAILACLLFLTPFGFCA